VAFLCVFALAVSGCESEQDASPSDGSMENSGLPVAFVSAVQIDSVEESVRLNLVFDGNISGLSPDDITVAWENPEHGEITAQSLVKSDETEGYILTLNGVAALGKITVRLDKVGYAFKPASKVVQVYSDYSGPPVDNSDVHISSIKQKFDVTAGGKDGVTAAFTALHDFIGGGGLVFFPNEIKLGDWIDLEGGLKVEDYTGTYGNGGGGFSYAGKSPYTRLIVVGINSFRSGKGCNRQYNITENDDVDHVQYNITENDGVDHVVFQFQNIPVRRLMNMTSTNVNGYAASEMREYLVPLDTVDGSGRFLAGLREAGVPVDDNEVLWSPSRVLSKDWNGRESVKVSDKLWLPTEREMLGYGNWSPGSENGENQAWLEYYDGNNSRMKKYDSKISPWYWTSSVYSGDSPSFCYVFSDGRTYYSSVRDTGGVAPAFCIK
jgi:hypothetical protein